MEADTEPVLSLCIQQRMSALSSALRLVGGAGITLPKSEFIKEHKKLVGILRKGTRKQQLAEAKDQSTELKKVTGGALEGEGWAEDLQNLTNDYDREMRKKHPDRVYLRTLTRMIEKERARGTRQSNRGIPRSMKGKTKSAVMALPSIREEAELEGEGKRGGATAAIRSRIRQFERDHAITIPAEMKTYVFEPILEGYPTIPDADLLNIWEGNREAWSHGRVHSKGEASIAASMFKDIAERMNPLRDRTGLAPVHLTRPGTRKSYDPRILPVEHLPIPDTVPAGQELAYQLDQMMGDMNPVLQNIGKGKKPKKWIQKVTEDMKKGAFTKQALRAGMTPEEFADAVMKHPEKHTLTTRRRAQFLINLRVKRGGAISGGGLHDIANAVDEYFYGSERTRPSRDEPRWNGVIASAKAFLKSILPSIDNRSFDSNVGRFNPRHRLEDVIEDAGDNEELFLQDVMEWIEAVRSIRQGGGKADYFTDEPMCGSGVFRHRPYRGGARLSEMAVRLLELMSRRPRLAGAIAGLVAGGITAVSLRSRMTDLPEVEQAIYSLAGGVPAMGVTGHFVMQVLEDIRAAFDELMRGDVEAPAEEPRVVVNPLRPPRARVANLQTERVPEPYRQDLSTLEEIEAGTPMTEYRHIGEHSTGHSTTANYPHMVGQRDASGRVVSGTVVRNYRGHGLRGGNIFSRIAAAVEDWDRTVAGLVRIRNLMDEAGLPNARQDEFEGDILEPFENGLADALEVEERLRAFFAEILAIHGSRSTRNPTYKGGVHSRA